MTDIINDMHPEQVKVKVICEKYFANVNIAFTKSESDLVTIVHGEQKIFIEKLWIYPKFDHLPNRFIAIPDLEMLAKEVAEFGYVGGLVVIRDEEKYISFVKINHEAGK